MKRTVMIGEREVGDGRPCFIIAEAGVNHNGDVDLARDLIDAASAAGADAVKFQTFSTGELVIEASEKARYQKETTGDCESQYEMLTKLELPPSAFRELKDHADRRGIPFLSTPFDQGSVDLLEEIGVPAYKIASGELTNHPLLVHVAATRRPVILSTGMADLSEIDEALRVLRGGGSGGILLLHAVSEYPPTAADLNLRAIGTLREAFGAPVGFSDHTPGVWAPVAAVAMGATVLEKHLTLDHSMPGPDHRASLEPGEFRDMVDAIRFTEAAMGDGIKRPTAGEIEMRTIARKSLVAAVDIPEGTDISPGMLAAKRPGTGISPRLLGQVSGRRSLRRIPKNTLIEWDMIE
ncbi:MAG TPA: N-acetylneuraminate synthase [Methanomicrobiales archaeon]|nr:N-acetylneuraminate synthase [Methanomicrobiales archaeon]